MVLAYQEKSPSNTRSSQSRKSPRKRFGLGEAAYKWLVLVSNGAGQVVAPCPRV